MAPKGRAGSGDQAAQRLFDAALACRAAAPERACALLQQALDHDPGPDLRHHIGMELVHLLTWRQPAAAEAQARGLVIDEHDADRVAKWSLTELQ